MPSYHRALYLRLSRIAAKPTGNRPIGERGRYLEDPFVLSVGKTSKEDSCHTASDPYHDQVIILRLLLWYYNYGLYFFGDRFLDKRLPRRKDSLNRCPNWYVPLRRSLLTASHFIHCAKRTTATLLQFINTKAQYNFEA